MGILVVDYPELSRGDSLQFLFACYPIPFGGIYQCSFLEAVRVAYLEADRSFRFCPRIFGDEMEVHQPEFVPVLFLGIIAPRYIQDVLFRIFFDNEPRTATQPQSFPLSDGVEPESFVGAQLPAGFQFDNLSLFFSQETADKIVVVDFPKETDALAVFASGTGQLGLFGYRTDFLLQVTA